MLGKEIPRIKKLREAKQLDHYMLFANRRLAGNAESEIREYIAAQCGIPPSSSIYLCGLEQLEFWLKAFPDVAAMADLDPDRFAVDRQSGRSCRGRSGAGSAEG